MVEDSAAEVKLTRSELNYLTSKRIGRLATVNRNGVPHVVPVMFSIGNQDRVVITGEGFEKSYKFKNAKENPRIAFVVDSVKLSPWSPMGIELRGIANVVTLGNGKKGIELIPIKKASWGLDEEKGAPPSYSSPTSEGSVA
jgi:pyridoxamine 5'-phosphate oxidase family protein